MKIKDKSDFATVAQIIALGYPQNEQYLDELLLWVCEPNDPIAQEIYQYFISLGVQEVQRVINAAQNADDLWGRYSIITNIMSAYGDDAINKCTDVLRKYANVAGTEECDIEALRVLAVRKLVDDKEIAKIARQNLDTYNMYIKETFAIAEKAFSKEPLAKYTL